VITKKLRRLKRYFENQYRGFLRSNFFQNIVCSLLYYYMQIVFYTSKKKFINWDIAAKKIEHHQPLIIVFWHNRLMMIPFVALKAKKANFKYDFLILASKHADGQFVSKIMSKFGLTTVSGSSKMGRSNDKGIDLSSFRKIFRSLKANISLAVTPDGPRGPAQKINGEIIEISKISGVPILPISYSTSNHKRLNSWDRFFFPLPFSKLCYYFGDIVTVDKDASEEEIAKIKSKLEEQMNEAEEKSLRGFNL
jgi:lysophospholipid acyltransferase (LPLAT)-like uncharacterized protein